MDAVLIRNATYVDGMDTCSTFNDNLDLDLHDLTWQLEFVQ